MRIRDAVEALRRADQARTNEIITKIGTQVEGIGGQITRFESDSRELRDRLLSEMESVARQFSEESRSTRNTIATATETRTREASKAIENAAVRLAGQQQESINGVKLLAYLTLVLVLLLASLQIYSFISA